MCAHWLAHLRRDIGHVPDGGDCKECTVELLDWQCRVQESRFQESRLQF